MKRISILALFILALALAGCGPVASPTHYEYDSHAVMTTTTAAAELAQANNRPVCVGLVILGSCNTSATQTQTTARPAAPARTTGDGFGLEDVVKAFIIAGMITALFVMLSTGLHWIFRDEYAA
jgi:hypothetical protein